jgi:pimeloyl-ACP methyl ester carboxylesterase
MQFLVMRRFMISFSLVLWFCLQGICQIGNVQQDQLYGFWLGVLEVTEQMKLQLAFQFEADSTGSLSARMNVIEQNAFDIPMNSCVLNGDSIHIRFDRAGIRFDGMYISGRDIIQGTYAQGGGKFNLDLSRVDELPLKVNRPQTPVRPFPYKEEEVKFSNEKAGILLAGTLTMPEKGDRYPALVLIAGSGRNDHNETEMGHFLLLSDFLTRHGYAVLRYDKRGVGESQGDYGTATTFDFADDARVAMGFLKSRPEIDPGRTGLLGHSEGALIAPIIAADREEGVAFIVMMGGMGVPGSDLLLMQSRKISEINGIPEKEIDETVKKNRALYQIAITHGSDSVLMQKMKGMDPAISDGMVRMLLSPWFRTFLSIDPDAYISQVTCPVLAITGENDVQCNAQQNLPAIEESLKKGGNSDYRVEALPGLNHLFQTSDTGSPYEYTRLEEIIAPVALDLILDWLNGVTVE